MKKKSPVRNYRSLVWIDLGHDPLVRRDHIESVRETAPGRIRFGTTSGLEIFRDVSDAKRILKELGFNEREEH